MATIINAVLPGGWTRVQGTVRFSTTIIEQANGFDESQSNWPYALWNFTASYTRGHYESVTELRLDDLYAGFLVALGMGLGFLVFDELDNHSDTMSGAGVVVEVDGDYRLVKLYTSTLGTYARLITRPAAGIVLGGGASAGTLDYDTGIVTGISADGTWTGSFYIPMRFASDDLTYDLNVDGEMQVTIPLREEREA